MRRAGRARESTSRMCATVAIAEAVEIVLILYIGRKHVVHSPSGLERRQYDVRRDRDATVDVIAYGVSDCGKHRAEPCTYRWLTDTACANRRFGIGNVERGGPHAGRHVQDRQRFAVMESHGQRYAVAAV